jgi:hypothetical protein
MSRRGHWIVRGLVVSAGLTLSACAIGAAQEPAGKAKPKEAPATIDNAFLRDRMKAWEEKIHSARFYFTENEVVTKGYESSRMTETGVKDKEAPIPDKDTNVERKCEVFIDGSRLRYAFEGPAWSQTQAGYASRKYLSVFDGDVGQFYWPPSADIPNAVILKAKKNQDTDNYHIRPIVLKLRPGLFLEFHGAERFQPSKNTAVFEGRTCIVFDNSEAPLGGLVESLWLDPALDYAVVRYTAGSLRQPDLQIDIHYKADPAVGPLPSDWTIVSRNLEPPSQKVSKCTVTKVDINQPIDIAEFRIQYAPGTWVHDMRTNKRFLQKEDETKRYILPSEAKATYEQLLKTEEGKALPQTDSDSGYRILFAVLGANLLLFVTVFFLYRRYRRQRTPAP